MPDCSNPVQCQTAKRLECTCACGGANHGKLRSLLDSEDPEQVKTGEEVLSELKAQQEERKKAGRVARRQRRAKERKATTTQE